MNPAAGDDHFELFDLRVEWEGDGPCWCKAKALPPWTLPRPQPAWCSAMLIFPALPPSMCSHRGPLLS